MDERKRLDACLCKYLDAGLESAHFLGGFNGDALVRCRSFLAVKLQVLVSGDLHVRDLTAAHSLKHLAEDLLSPRSILGHEQTPGSVLLSIPGAALCLSLYSIPVQKRGSIGVFVVVDPGETSAHVGLRMVVGVGLAEVHVVFGIHRLVSARVLALRHHVHVF